MVELLNYSLRSALFNALPPFPSISLGAAGYTLPGHCWVGSAPSFWAEVFTFGVRLRDDVEGTI